MRLLLCIFVLLVFQDKWFGQEFVSGLIVVVLLIPPISGLVALVGRIMRVHKLRFMYSIHGIKTVIEYTKRP